MHCCGKVDFGASRCVEDVRAALHHRIEGTLLQEVCLVEAQRTRKAFSKGLKMKQLLIIVRVSNGCLDRVSFLKKLFDELACDEARPSCDADSGSGKWGPCRQASRPT